MSFHINFIYNVHLKSFTKLYLRFKIHKLCAKTTSTIRKFKIILFENGSFKNGSNSLGCNMFNVLK